VELDIQKTEKINNDHISIASLAFSETLRAAAVHYCVDVRSLRVLTARADPISADRFECDVILERRFFGSHFVEHAPVSTCTMSVLQCGDV